MTHCLLPSKNLWVLIHRKKGVWRQRLACRCWGSTAFSNRVWLPKWFDDMSGTALGESPIQFPAPTLDYSQSPVTPGYPMSSSASTAPTHMCIHPNRNKYTLHNIWIKTKQNDDKNKSLGPNHLIWRWEYKGQICPVGPESQACCNVSLFSQCPLENSS